MQNIKEILQNLAENMIPLIAAEFKERCIEASMKKTEVKPRNEGNISLMRKRYGMLYDEDRITASILRFIAFESRARVAVDYTSSLIGGMKPKLIDHDGRERSGSEFWSFADFGEGKAYAGGSWSSDRNAIKYLVHALSQLALYYSFNNNGHPYSGDGERFKGILEEAEKKKRDGVEMDWWIKCVALVQANRRGKEIYLASAVPYMIAEYRPSSGRSKLRAQLPSLLDYYDGHVVATLDNATKVRPKQKKTLSIQLFCGFDSNSLRSFEENNRGIDTRTIIQRKRNSIAFFVKRRHCALKIPLLSGKSILNA